MESSNNINAVISRLENELALHVECMDEETTIDCDIQRLINSYRKISKAWHILNEVNDENMKVLRDYKEEVKQLNHELDNLREAIE